MAHLDEVRGELRELGEAIWLATNGRQMLVANFADEFARGIERMIDAKLAQYGGAGFYRRRPSVGGGSA